MRRARTTHSRDKHARLTAPRIAHAREPLRMARAMRLAAESGRAAYLAGRIPKKLYATASSPLEGAIAGTNSS